MPARKKPPATTQQLLLTQAHPDGGSEPAAFWTVSEVLDWLKQAIDDHPILGHTVTVRGELSNLRPASSGHVYGTIKDDSASLNIVLWRSTAQKLPFQLQDGMAVLATGQFNVYAPGGSVSMVVQRLIPDGIGALQLAFEQLKAQLMEEGLFDDSRKQPLPGFPLRIGIVTSPTGSVIHDMWRVIRQKNPCLTALIAPVAVQGDAAAQQIADAIQRLNHPALQLDAIIVARGGGSFEDLFCFSQEVVVRAIVASRLPVVTGIGHQPDYGLADAAADYSAATPTAAADALTPDADAWATWLSQQQGVLHRELTQRLASEAQRLDVAMDRLQTGFEQLVSSYRYRAETLAQRLQEAATAQVRHAGEQLARQAGLLDQLSPLATLSRGYAVVQTGDKQVINAVGQLSPGQSVRVLLKDGHFLSEVRSVSTSLDAETNHSNLSTDYSN